MSVSVVHAGARTAIGLDARQTGFLLRAGLPAMAESPLADASGEAVSMGFVPTLDPRLLGPERLAALARPAFAEAASPVADASVLVHLILDEGYRDAMIARPMLEAMIAREIPRAQVTVEPKGEAALGALIPEVIRALEARRFDAAILGGVHSDYDPEILAELEAGGRLFSRENLDARIPGEAAAFLVLMRDAEASRRGLAPIARILGTGVGTERARPDNDEPAYEASGLSAAVRQATEPLVKSGETAGWMLTDLTFEMRRLHEWESVWVRSQKVLGRPYIIESPAQRIGYLGAAALPLLGAVVTTAFRHRYAPSDLALATAGADGGGRAALVLGRA